MKVLIQSPFTINDAQEEEIKSAVASLDTYNNKITQAEVYFKTDDGTMPDAILAEVQIHVPGPVVFASDTAQQFMGAFNGALNKAKKQLRKAKEIRQDY